MAHHARWPDFLVNDSVLTDIYFSLALSIFIHSTRTTYMVNYTAMIISLTKFFKGFLSYAFTHEGDKNSFIQRSC